MSSVKWGHLAHFEPNSTNTIFSTNLYTVEITINKTIGRSKFICRKIIAPDKPFEKIVNFVIAKIMMKYKK